MNALALALLMVASKAKHAPPVQVETRYRDIHYALALDLDAQSGEFTTTTGLTLSPSAATSTVVLDAQDLEIASVKEGDSELKYTLATDAAGTSKLTINLPSEAPAGAPLQLSIKAKGKAAVGGSLGMIRTEDPDHPGRTVYYTMFEPDGARRVFPSLDRPADKATFDVSVTTDAALQVISNGVQAGDEKVEGEGAPRHRVTWKQEKPQSTYLVAVAIGSFEGTPVAGTSVPASIFTAPGDGSRVSFAADATKAGMAYLTEFLQTPFPWTRYDQVAIPEFPWSGMENTSATFLRASTLMPPADALASRNTLTRLIDHEMAHQWFGDDVTPKGWSEVWLNESFATYLSRITADEISKNDFAFVEAMLDQRDTYFRFEDGPRSRPLVSDATTAEDSFDAAAYLKGASVLRMLEKIVGRDAFRKGLKAYLNDHAYANASSDDLFAALTSASGKDLTEFKKAWLGQAGYPVLKISRRWLEGQKQLAVTVVQTPNHAGKKSLWPAPLTIVAHRTAEPSYHLDFPLALEKATETIAIPLPAEPEWIDWNQGNTVLARLETNEKVEALAAQAEKDPDPMARLWADLELAGALADPDRKSQVAPPEANLEALAHALKSDRSPYVRAGVLRELTRGTFKRLPDALSGTVLEQAVAPSNLADDPLGAAELRKAGYAALGKVEDSSVMGILGKAIKDPKSSLDLVSGAALGLGHRGDGPSVVALKDGLAIQTERGQLYLRAVLEGLASVEDASVVPTLIAQAHDHRSSLEVLAGMRVTLSDNRGLIKTAAGTQMVADLAGDASFDTESRARWLSLLDDVKTPGAKAALGKLVKSPNPRIAALAKQQLKGNFGH